MINYISKEKDVVWLAYRLKDCLGSRVSINQYGMKQRNLLGYYTDQENKFARINGVDFHIKYSRKEFLRIGIGEIKVREPYEKKLEALKIIGKELSEIKERGGLPIGPPLAFYNSVDEEGKVPTLEWAFCNSLEYSKELSEGTLFDDATIEDLVWINEKLKIKTI
ncbi:MAG: hypothetical protein HFG40_02675 [Bacilli bacterium]|nr:hypothetical protein [Bacilli bacterium]